MPFNASLAPLAERVRSFGPVRADNSRVHRELLVDGGRGEPEGALALLRQLQRRRGGWHPRQRGRRPERGERPALALKGPETQDSLCRFQVETEPCALAPTVMAFLENHGKNIQLSNQNLTAARVSSYNQGLLVTAQPLARQQLFQVTLLYGVHIWFPMTPIQLRPFENLSFKRFQ